MITKFNVGDIVQCNDTKKILTIRSILVDKTGLVYYVNENMGCYYEYELTSDIQKVKKYKYVYESIYTDLGLVVSSNWYENDDSFQKNNPFVKEFEKLDRWGIEE